MTALKLKLVEPAALPAAGVGAAEGQIVALPPKKARFASRAAKWFANVATVVVPPLIVVLLLLTVWEMAASGPKTSLPPPSKIWSEAKDLILQPFFVNGSQDIGLGWRVLTSLQRVVIGFSLAAFVGILTGALVGQSQWAMRGLDPIFQILRTVPPLAWLPISLAAFRDSAPSAIAPIKPVLPPP